MLHCCQTNNKYKKNEGGGKGGRLIIQNTRGQNINKKNMIDHGIEPRTCAVLRRRHNQLDQSTVACMLVEWEARSRFLDLHPLWNGKWKLENSE